MPEQEQQLQRVYELRDFSISLGSRQAYFRRDDDKLSHPWKRQSFIELEGELQGLDTEAWVALKSDALPLLRAKHPTRGWQPLFDTLNEAKGYNYLVRIGCKDVRFIPRSTIAGVRTPDLRAMLGPARVLCEVKTINRSDDEINRWHVGGVGTTLTRLDDKFLNKLVKAIDLAASQLAAFDSEATARRIVYVVVHFDEKIECQDEYRKQIETHIASLSTPAIEIVLSTI